MAFYIKASHLENIEDYIRFIPEQGVWVIMRRKSHATKFEDLVEAIEFLNKYKIRTIYNNACITKD